MESEIDFQARMMAEFWRQHRFLAAALPGLLVLMLASALGADRQIVLNTSDSMPHGLYRRIRGDPHVGQIIDFTIPDAARPYILARTGQSGCDWYILKTIAAGPGDSVDTTGEYVLINGQPHGKIYTHDTAGRPLPQWHAKRVLGPDEYVVLSERIPSSFDSRYFGPVRRSEIAAVRKALITWE